MHNFSFSERFFKEMEAPACVTKLKNERKCSYVCQTFYFVKTEGLLEKKKVFYGKLPWGDFPSLISSGENAWKQFRFVYIFLKGIYGNLFWESTGVDVMSKSVFIRDGNLRVSTSTAIGGSSPVHQRWGSYGNIRIRSQITSTFLEMSYLSHD